MESAPAIAAPTADPGITVIRSGLLLKFGGKSWAKKLQWRQCRLLNSGVFEYSEVKKDGLLPFVMVDSSSVLDSLLNMQTLELKGVLKLKDAECRVEGPGGVMYDVLVKMVGNQAKIPKVPSSKTPPAWDGHGFFYVKPAMLRVKKPGKVYFFVCNAKDRDAWIDAVRQAIGAQENLRLSSIAQNQSPAPLRQSPSSPSLTVPGNQQFAPGGLSSQNDAFPPAAAAAAAAPLAVPADPYMQARAVYGPASSSSHSAFATLRSGKTFSEANMDDGSSASPIMVSTFDGTATSSHSPSSAEPQQAELQKAQLNSFFQAPAKAPVRNPEKVAYICSMDMSQLLQFVSNLGFPASVQYLIGLSGQNLIDVSLEDLIERGVDLEEAKRLRTALRDYLSV